MPIKWSIDRKTTAGFGAALAALVGIGAFSFLSLSRLKNTSYQVEHTYKVIYKLGMLLSQLTDAETGQRGYLLTGELRYLKPYKNAIASIDQKTLTNSRRGRNCSSSFPPSPGRICQRCHLYRGFLVKNRQSHAPVELRQDGQDRQDVRSR